MDSYKKPYLTLFNAVTDKPGAAAAAPGSFYLAGSISFSR